MVLTPDRVLSTQGFSCEEALMLLGAAAKYRAVKVSGYGIF